MSKYTKNRQKILLADDSAMNRALLIDILENEFDIVEVENGAEAVAILQDHAAEFSLLLLDIVMPEMDGYEVLAFMNRYHWIEDIPVIIISAENSSKFIERAYEFGVTDFISRPYDATIVRSRVRNTMLLTAKQRRLMDIVTDQMYEKEKSDKLMISILSHIVEFRNGESGVHVLHINAITELILKKLIQMTDRYPMTSSDISMITVASALHDIGKIAIPGEILNKPGRLTAEEFEIMKRHSIIGAGMLDELPPGQKNEPLVKTAYEICRWHHERYDGGGYPDGLAGDAIPISAQVVALADVYDALTSERCYKPAYSHERAVEMILGGQCGAFNPLLMDCLRELADTLHEELKINSAPGYVGRDLQNIRERLNSYELYSADRILQQQEYDRQQLEFLSGSDPDPVFRYTVSPQILSLNEQSAKLLGLPGMIVEPQENHLFDDKIDARTLAELRERLQNTTVKSPMVMKDLRLELESGPHWFRCMLCTVWSQEKNTEYVSVIGRLIDIQAQKEMDEAVEEEMRLQPPYVERKTTAHHQKLNRDGITSMTGYEAWNLLQELQEIHDMVRLVDASVSEVVTVDGTGKVQHSSNRCYCVWDRTERCDNCISARCICSKKRQAKFEFIKDEIFYIVAMYVEIDGKGYSMEMVNKVSDDTLMSGYGREMLIDYISEHNEKLYVDPVTDVRNRRYYEEQLKGLQKVDAVALIDVDRFKEINDSYGHQAGDRALQMIAETIQDCVRRSDAMLRYGGDEFVIVFRSIPQPVFEEKLTRIKRAVKRLEMPGTPGLQFSVSIGGAYGPGGCSELLAQADERMYWEKRHK